MTRRRALRKKCAPRRNSRGGSIVATHSTTVRGFAALSFVISLTGCSSAGMDQGIGVEFVSLEVTANDEMRCLDSSTSHRIELKLQNAREGEILLSEFNVHAFLEGGKWKGGAIGWEGTGILRPGEVSLVWATFCSNAQVLSVSLRGTLGNSNVNRTVSVPPDSYRQPA